jgi:hypothetical protein
MERVARRFVLVLRGGAAEQMVLEGEAEEEPNPHTAYEEVMRVGDVHVTRRWVVVVGCVVTVLLTAARP